MNGLILKDVEGAFGLRVKEVAPVSGGWLNEKWRVTTDAGEILVKRYSHERFTRRKIDEIEQALHRQMLLFGGGIPCPRVWKAGERIIRRPSDGIDYMVMDFVSGVQIGPENVSLRQMESLGEACGRMHEAFARMPAKGVKGYPLDAGKFSDALRETVRKGREACAGEVPEAFREALDEVEKAMERLSAGLFDRMEQGIAHEDFTGDNMLFSDEGIAAILDFDRNQFSFPLHDVGRALLSLALHNGKLDEARVEAFRAGYSVRRPLADRDISNALTLSWMIEVPWWIQLSCFAGRSQKVGRFVDEMRFLSGNISDFR